MGRKNYKIDIPFDNSFVQADQIQEFQELFSTSGIAYESSLNWKSEGLCMQTDPESFFPEKGNSIYDAKKVCARCSVKEECLNYALENDERFGIWGGLSERERRKIKRQQEAEQNNL